MVIDAAIGFILKYFDFCNQEGSDSPRSRVGDDQEKPYISLVESRPSSTKTLLTQVMAMVIGDIDEARLQKLCPGS